MGATLRGVLELNLLLLVSGLAVLWAARGFRSWLEVLDGLGLAFLLGMSTIGLLATLVLVAGGGLSYATVFGLCVAVSGSAAFIAVKLRRTIPRSFGQLPHLSLATLAACLCALASVVILVSLFRLARVMPLGGGDSFEDWVPKAKLIYFDGSIYSNLFKSLPAGRHPSLSRRFRRWTSALWVRPSPLNSQFSTGCCLLDSSLQPHRCSVALYPRRLPGCLSVSLA